MLYIFLTLPYPPQLCGCRDVPGQQLRHKALQIQGRREGRYGVKYFPKKHYIILEWSKLKQQFMAKETFSVIFKEKRLWMILDYFQIKA